jgi:hypothetical protein
VSRRVAVRCEVRPRVSREGGDAPYVDKDRLKGSLFNEDLSPHEAAGVAECVHKVAGMCALGVTEGAHLAT